MIDIDNPPGVGTSRLPNARDISNAVVSQGTSSILNPLGASDWIWQWGQFTRLRDRDRFFYQGDSSMQELFPEIAQTRLSDVLLRKTSI